MILVNMTKTKFGTTALVHGPQSVAPFAYG